MHATLETSNMVYKVILELSLAFMPAIIALILNKKEGGNWKSLRFVKPSLLSILLAIFIPLLYVIVDFRGPSLQCECSYDTFRPVFRRRNFERFTIRSKFWNFYALIRSNCWKI